TPGTGCTSRGCRRSRRRRGSAASASSCALHLARQKQRERRALADRAFERDAAIEHAGQPPADGQPQTRARVLSRRRVVGLTEILEDALAIVGRNSDPRVDDGDRDLVTWSGQVLRPDLHGALWGEFDRVAQEVDQDLLD